MKKEEGRGRRQSKKYKERDRRVNVSFREVCASSYIKDFVMA